MPQLSVVIPAYNEAHRLPSTLSEVLPSLRAHFNDFEVLVVDDGSRDDMVSKIENLRDSELQIIKFPKHRGKGAAVRQGCLQARGDYVLFMDADHAVPISEVKAMLSSLQKTGKSVAVGLRTYQSGTSRGRRILGLLLQLLAHLLVFDTAVIDSQCGFKLFTRGAAQKLFSLCRVNGGMLDVELFYLMERLKIEYIYQIVTWKNKPGSTINVFRCLCFDPWDLLAIRFRRYV